MQLLYMILYGLQKIKGERTASSIYHLLKGKRSSQTLQDTSIYELSCLFGLQRKLNRQAYDEQIEQLLNEQCLEKIQENTYIVTERGEEKLKKSTDWMIPAHVDGFRYGDTADVLWKRLSLVVQSISHLQRRDGSFLPIQQEAEVTQWVKQFLLSATVTRQELAQALYKECVTILAQLPEQDCRIFVLRLSGAQRIGYTEEQIAQQLQEDAVRIHVFFLGALHVLARHALEETSRYPLLAQLAGAEEQRLTGLSLSTVKTYELWKQGKTIEEMVVLRRLKRSTIEDHIVEIAMHEAQFPLVSFVSKEKMEKIQNVMMRVHTRKLRELKEHIGEDVTYFEIRLMLARMGGKQDETRRRTIH